MHRRADYFGDDAKIFRPERWEENPKHGWDFLPFNGGPRICLGRKLTVTYPYIHEPWNQGLLGLEHKTMEPASFFFFSFFLLYTTPRLV